jgi:hypothetical protein
VKNKFPMKIIMCESNFLCKVILKCNKFSNGRFLTQTLFSTPKKSKQDMCVCVNEDIFHVCACMCEIGNVLIYKHSFNL